VFRNRKDAFTLDARAYRTSNLAGEHWIFTQVLPGPPSARHPCDVQGRRQDCVLPSGQGLQAKRHAIAVGKLQIEARSQR
jgi:hypothetical protein